MHNQREQGKSVFYLHHRSQYAGERQHNTVDAHYWCEFISPSPPQWGSGLSQVLFVDFGLLAGLHGLIDSSILNSNQSGWDRPKCGVTGELAFQLPQSLSFCLSNFPLVVQSMIDR